MLFLLQYERLSLTYIALFKVQATARPSTLRWTEVFTQMDVYGQRSRVRTIEGLCDLRFRIVIIRIYIAVGGRILGGKH